MATVTLVVETVHAHTTYPWPQKIGQENEQSLKYEGDLLVLSPYKTGRKGLNFGACSCTMRWRITNTKPVRRNPVSSRTPPPRAWIHSRPDNIATKMGATITYGPFTTFRRRHLQAFIEQHQKHVVIHYSLVHLWWRLCP